MKRFALFVVLPMIIPACGWLTSGNQQVGQAEIKNFETRSVDAKFEDVYAAATEALFDLGYQIKHSEKASGLIVGEQHYNYSETVYLGKGIWDRRDKQRVYEITLLIKPENKKSTNVRIKTSVDGQPRLNKDAIDKVWVYIDRQVLMESSATPQKKGKTPNTKASGKTD
jgi:hypothetical protein